MRAFGKLALMTLGTALLSGCMTAVPKVDVTRFHTVAGANPLAGASFSIALFPASGLGIAPASPDSLEWASYRAAVEQELLRLGMVTPPADARATFQVMMGFDRNVQMAEERRSPVSVGVGGSTGRYGGGLGVGVGIDLSPKPKDKLFYQLSVRINRSADGVALWEGRAETAVAEGTPAAQPSLAAAKLAGALFQGFPGESGRTITVE